MKAKKGFLVLSSVVTVILLMLILAGCSETTTTSTQTTQSSTQISTTATPSATGGPQSGGVLTIITPSAITNLGDVSVPLTASDIMHATPAVETLLRNDEKGGLIPWLATDWDIADDKQSVTLTLRQGVKFHDGTDFNADAVKTILDIYRNSSQTELKAISSIDVIGDYSIKINLSNWETAFLSNFTWAPGRIVSPTAMKTKEQSWLLTHPVGTGPFEFVSYQKDVSLVFKKFEGYWQEGKPYLDGVEIHPLLDRTVALMSLKTGEAQLSAAITPAQVDDLVSSGYDMAYCPSAVQCLAGDSVNADSPFADVRVRRAVAYACDMDALNKMVGGGYQSTNQLAIPGSLAFNPNVKGYPYDPEKAKELLSEAGYPNGFDTSLIFGNFTGNNIAETIQGYLREVGINAEINLVDAAGWAQTRVSGWHNALFYYAHRATIGYDPVAGLVARFSDRTKDFVSIMHPAEYEELLTQAITEVDFDKRDALIRDMMAIITDEYALLAPMHVQPMIVAKQKNVHNTNFWELWAQQSTLESAWIGK